jgi:N-acetylneuraminic acid mutarotase
LEERSLLSGGSWAAVAPLRTARVYLGSATGNNGIIYAVGGFQQGDVPFAEVDAYNPRTNTWTTVAPLPTARGALAVVAGNNGIIYAIGGSQGGTTCFSEVDAYNPRTNTWTTVAPLPTALGDLAAAVGNDGTIYAIGGNVRGTDGTSATTEVDAYNPHTNQWTEVAPLSASRS